MIFVVAIITQEKKKEDIATPPPHLKSNKNGQILILNIETAHKANKLIILFETLQYIVIITIVIAFIKKSCSLLKCCTCMYYYNQVDLFFVPHLVHNGVDTLPPPLISSSKKSLSPLVHLQPPTHPLVLIPRTSRNFNFQQQK